MKIQEAMKSTRFKRKGNEHWWMTDGNEIIRWDNGVKFRFVPTIKDLEADDWVTIDMVRRVTHFVIKKDNDEYICYDGDLEKPDDYGCGNTPQKALDDFIKHISFIK